MKSVFGLLVCVAVVSGFACVGPEDELVPISEQQREIDYDAVITDIRNGTLSGDLGPVSDFATESDELFIYDDDDSSFILIQSQAMIDEEHAVMLFLSTSDQSIFMPGTESLFNNLTLDNTTGILGCVGSSFSNFDMYDAPADEVLVTVVEGAEFGLVDVLVVGTWFDLNNEPVVATMTFSIQR